MSKDVESTQRLRLKKVINRLSFSNPFLFELLSLMDIKIERDIGGVIPLETACTYSKVIVVNPDFMASINDIELLTVLDHELNHYVRGHTTFNSMQVPPHLHDLLNVAMDYEINYRLVEYSYYCGENNRDKKSYRAQLPKINGKECCYSKKYNEDWNYRSIFHDLLKDSDNISDFSVMDMHLSAEDLEKLKQAGVVIHEVDKSEIAGNLMGALSRAKAIGSGNIPDHYRDLMDGLVKPEFDYFALLHGIVSAQIKEDPNWTRPKRKYLDMGYYLPDAADGKMFKTGMFFDLSGSIGEKEANKFKSEYFGLLDMLPAFELHVACFSDRVHENTYHMFTKDDLDAEDFQFLGTGGTDLSCVTDFLEAKEIELDNLIVLTDGYTQHWMNPEYCKNIIVICTTDVVSPVGDTYHIKL